MEKPDPTESCPVIAEYGKPYMAIGLARALNVPRERVEGILQQIAAELREAKAPPQPKARKARQ